MKITAAESQIMDVLWRADRPLAAEEIREILTENWSEATVRTFLTRLVNKQALAAARDGKRFIYSPLVDRAAYVHSESKSVLDRLFGGSVTPFLAHFSEHQRLSEAEIADLKRLVEGLDHGK